MKSRPWAAAVGGASAGAAIALVAAGVAVIFRSLAPHEFSVAACEALVASGTLALLAWRAPRLAVGAALGVAFALVINEIGGCSNALAIPLATIEERGIDAEFSVVFMGVLVLFVGSVAALPFAALAMAVRRRALQVAITIAIGATLASAFVTARGLASMRRPEPDDLEAIFDQTTTLAAGQHMTLGPTRLDYEHTADEYCVLTTERPAVGAVLDAVGGACPELRVHRDGRSGAGFVARDDFGVQHPLAIFGTRDERRELRVGDVAGRVGAPRAWTFGGCLGMALGAFAVAAAIVAARKRRAVDDAIEGTHLGDGWIAVADAKRHVASLSHAPAGPIVVTATRRGAPTYRDDGSPHALAVRPGTRDDLRDEIATRALAWSCVAIATLATTSAPLWVAQVSGLL